METRTKNILWTVNILFWLVFWIWIFGLAGGILAFLILGLFTALVVSSYRKQEKEKLSALRKQQEERLIREAQLKQARQVLDGKEAISEPTLSKETIIKETVVREVVMILCPHCQALMPNTSLYCPNCGAPKKR